MWSHGDEGTYPLVNEVETQQYNNMGHIRWQGIVIRNPIQDSSPRTFYPMGNNCSNQHGFLGKYCVISSTSSDWILYAQWYIADEHDDTQNGQAHSHICNWTYFGRQTINKIWRWTGKYEWRNLTKTLIMSSYVPVNLSGDQLLLLLSLFHHVGDRGPRRHNVHS